MAKTQIGTELAKGTSQRDIDLLNEVKAVGAELLRVHAKVRQAVEGDRKIKVEASRRVFRQHRDNAEEFDLKGFDAAEPNKWLQISRTDIQRGLMALERAILRPLDD